MFQMFVCFKQNILAERIHQAKRHRIKDLQGAMVQLVHVVGGPMLPVFKGRRGQRGRTHAQVPTGVAHLWGEAQGTRQHLTGSLIPLP